MAKTAAPAAPIGDQAADAEAEAATHRDRYLVIFEHLQAPFQPWEVKTRTQGKVIAYITARTVMNRLDNVLGPANWWAEYTPHEDSVLCRLTIRLPDGSTLTKADAGAYAGMADAGDDDKSGYSDAIKRAAVQFGVARYLYNEGVPDFAATIHGGTIRPNPLAGVTADKHPEDHQRDARDARRADTRNAQPAGGGANQGQHQGPPRSGRALFAWTKEMEQKYEVGLLKYINQWAKLQDLPGRMVDWNADQVHQAYTEAVRKLQAYESSKEEAYEEALSD